MNGALLAQIANDITIGGLLVAILPFVVLPLCILAAYGRDGLRNVFAIKRFRTAVIAICVLIFGIDSYTKDGTNYSQRASSPSSHSRYGRWHSHHGREGNLDGYKHGLRWHGDGDDTPNLMNLNEEITDDTDTDGDGIPDWYEGITHTNPQVDDGDLDFDEDGLTNLQEYQFYTDPIRADTDDDRFDDLLEVLGQLSGIDDLHPINKATFNYPETDSDADGIPDYWEENGYAGGVFEEMGYSPDLVGFDYNYYNNFLEETSDSNYDVAITLTSS